MSNRPKCFIVMPISVPETALGLYRDGALHFEHVLECLHIPAIERAGFEAVPPSANGSELIHAEIIESLQKSENVLCDMSCLNPNVFFEWGIRTSLNKPVAVVRDECVSKVPFDTGILNHHEYKSSLEAWELESEISKLSVHIEIAFTKSKGKNALWRHFGTTIGSHVEAEPYKSENLTADSLELILGHVQSLGRQIEEIQKSLNPSKRAISSTLSEALTQARATLVKDTLEKLLGENSVVFMNELEKTIKVMAVGKQNPIISKAASNIARQHGFEIHITWIDLSKSDQKKKSGEKD